MATTKKPMTSNQYDGRSLDSFLVTCVVGEVTLDPMSDVSPGVAAFSLIAEHDAPGTYRFPMHNGRICSVTVEYTDDEQDGWGGPDGITSTLPRQH